MRRAKALAPSGNESRPANCRSSRKPWVRVQCLSSKALGLSLRQLAADWQHQHGVRPVLAETYVSQPYADTCYRASNWQYLGQTQARGAMGAFPPRRPRPSSCIRYSATGRRFCSHPNALPAPARRPPHWTAHERLSRPLALRNLNAYHPRCRIATTKDSWRTYKAYNCNCYAL